MTEHPDEDLAAFSLGLLVADERALIEVHLRTCDACRSEAAAFADTAWLLAEVVARPTPARLRNAVLERVRGERPARPRLVSLRPLVAMLARPVPLAVPLILVIALVAAVAGVATGRAQTDRYAAALAAVAGGRVVTLTPTGELAGVRGSLVLSHDGGLAYLVLDIPATPADHTWEAWVLGGAAPIPAGLTAERGLITLALTAPIANGDDVALTLEPAGGSSTPTGKPVLVGKF